MPLDPHKFLNRDGMQFLEQCVSKKQIFDLVICDVPSFSRGEAGLFKLEVELEALCELLLRVLAPGGSLIFTTHHESLFIDDLRKVWLKTAKKLGSEVASVEISSIQSALDFELPGEKVAMKSFLIRRLE